MNELEKLKKRHAEAVRALGDLLVKRMLIDEQIAAVRREIEAMDVAALVIGKVGGD